jgi:Protein of unknown function (DUF3592)
MAADIILILMGLTVCFLMLKSRNKNLIKYGNKVEGVIVDYDSAAQKNDTNKFPIVRFTTIKEELFTLPSPEGFLPARVKMGKKVFVLYNPQNPKEFTIQLPNEQLMFITLVAAAIIFTITGVVLLLNELDIIHVIKK